MEIRFVKKEDYPQILSIYASYIENSVYTFEYEVPSIEEFSNRIDNISKNMPYLVAVENNQVIGYAYASKYKPRLAYQWAVEISIYLDSNHKQRGVGTLLYNPLLLLLKQLGYYRVYACITDSNLASIAFHKKYHFVENGKFHKVGYKHKQWLDVIWMELSICDDDASPVPPKTIQEIKYV